MSFYLLPTSSTASLNFLSLTLLNCSAVFHIANYTQFPKFHELPPPHDFLSGSTRLTPLSSKITLSCFIILIVSKFVIQFFSVFVVSLKDHLFYVLNYTTYADHPNFSLFWVSGLWSQVPDRCVCPDGL